ncbi:MULTISPECIES: DUF3450 domain-containing protein [unclassified Agarivorans]|uniref:DUF3450 domain-containing protein n=1 Tax=Agarivorans sp. Z349TD_7 TaxID=3421431 RepID=UPI003D7F0B72
MDQLDAQRQATLNEKRQLRLQSELLEQYNLHLHAMLLQQQQQLQQLKGDLTSLAQSEQHALPLVHQMLNELTPFVARDLPFLSQERELRLQDLVQLLNRADMNLAEKYRQVLDAYQIEMEYGETIEAYQAMLNERQVNFFRLDRTALYYQTLNAQQSALWDPATQQWQILSPTDNLSLRMPSLLLENDKRLAY